MTDPAKPNVPLAYNPLLRLARIARSLESGGQYNAAKLFWAVSYSASFQVATALRASLNIDELGQEVADALDEMLVAGADPHLMAYLKQAWLAAQDHRPIPFSEIPEVNVCRKCGQVMIGTPPKSCPVCDADQLTFRDILPIYFLEPLAPEQAIAALASAPAELAEMLAEISDEQINAAPGPGEWSLRETLQHILVSQELLKMRVERILQEQNPVLEGVAAWEISGVDDLPVKEILARYQSSRQATIERLDTLQPQDWQRSAFHTEFSRITLIQQVSYFARHERDHWAQIKSLRASNKG